MINKFVVATNNPHKVEEFKRIFNPLNIEIISASDAGVDFSSVEETGVTFAENAKLKAMYAFKCCGLSCIADDSGLCVEALNGRPGVFSARYAGENATDDDRINLLLSQLSGVDYPARKAFFCCSICCIFDENDIISVEGKCHGYIGFDKKGINGFGYDPIFYLPNGKSFASLTASQKDSCSHRGVALKKLYELLTERMK